MERSRALALHPEPSGPVPQETAWVARAALATGNPYRSLRDALGVFDPAAQCAALFPPRGQPAAAPWRLALIVVLQVAENLTDRQAAAAVRRRIAWTSLLGLEVTDRASTTRCCARSAVAWGPGAQRSACARPCCSTAQRASCLKRAARGRQRTAAPPVLAAIRVRNRRECGGAALRHALNTRAGGAPPWLRTGVPGPWVDRYAPRMES